MKKKTFKSKLSLKKNTISNLQSASITGGDRSNWFACRFSFWDDSNCNSARGCTDGPDETMTCAEHSCLSCFCDD